MLNSQGLLLTGFEEQGERGHQGSFKNLAWSTGWMVPFVEKENMGKRRV